MTHTERIATLTELYARLAAWRDTAHAQLVHAAPADEAPARNQRDNYARLAELAAAVLADARAS